MRQELPDGDSPAAWGETEVHNGLPAVEGDMLKLSQLIRAFYAPSEAPKPVRKVK